MTSMFLAEWKKITGHRWLTSFLLWILPVGAGTFLIFEIIAALLAPDAARKPFALEQGEWTTTMVGIWDLLYSFPGNIFGRLPLLAFTVVIFAGEYEWGTWKNIVPHNRRATLILVKFAALGAFIFLVFGATSVIVAVGRGIAIRAAGGEYGPALTTEVLTDFAGDYLLHATLAFVSTIIVSSFAALAAMATRSIISGLLMGFLLSVGEPISLLFFSVLGQLLNNMQIVRLYQLMPSFNLDNIALWAQFNQGVDLNQWLSGVGASVSVDPVSLPASLMMAAAWVAGLIALTIFLFRRQDITT